ncbi:MAG: DUF4350 domain-containing protein, partial [Deltaproteobacteria bacterium]|nr:DUF4350 domain-containing protein [Deltaproteobacteria bacterium]
MSVQASSSSPGASRSGPSRARRWVAAGLGLVALLLGVAMCRGVAERGRYATAYSTFGAGPEGAKGIYLVLERLGGRVERWVRDLDRLPPRGALVVLGGCGSSLAHAVSRTERRELDRWIVEGGTLVVAGATGYVRARSTPEPDDASTRGRTDRDALGDVGVAIVAPTNRCRARMKEEEAERRRSGTKMREDPIVGLAEARSLLDEAPPVVVRARPVDPALAGIGTVTFSDPLALKVDAPEGTDVRILLASEQGEPLAAAVRRGRGHVVVVASGDALQNSTLGASGGDVLLVRLLRTFAPETLGSAATETSHDARARGADPRPRAPILFDEYHLGVGERRGLMTYVNQLGLGPVALQAVIAIALAVLAFSARFGAPRLAAPPDPHDTRTYVGALGRIYARTADVRGIVTILVREALARVAREQRIGVADPVQIAARLETRKQPETAAAVRQLAKIAEEDARGKGVLAETVRSIDSLVA